MAETLLSFNSCLSLLLPSPPPPSALFVWLPLGKEEGRRERSRPAISPPRGTQRQSAYLYFHCLTHQLLYVLPWMRRISECVQTDFWCESGTNSTVPVLRHSLFHSKLSKKTERAKARMDSVVVYKGGRGWMRLGWVG